MFISFIIILIIGGAGAYWAYGNIFSPNTAFEQDAISIQVPKKSSFEEAVQILKEKNVLKDETSFKRVAEWMNYQRKVVPSGNFELKKNWNNKQIISKLRSGIQNQSL